MWWRRGSWEWDTAHYVSSGSPLFPSPSTRDHSHGATPHVARGKTLWQCRNCTSRGWAPFPACTHYTFGKHSLCKDRVSNILWSVVFPYKVWHQPLCNTSLKAASLRPSKGLLQDLKRCECPGQWPHPLLRKALDTGQWGVIFQEGFWDLSGPMRTRFQENRDLL